MSQSANITFGVRLPNSGPLASPESMLQVAREAEELGFAATGTDIMRQGGTVLDTTNKGNPFAFPMPDGTVLDRPVRRPGADGDRGVGRPAVPAHGAAGHRPAAAG